MLLRVVSNSLAFPDDENVDGQRLWEDGQEVAPTRKKETALFTLMAAA